jgi:hypothetical protein
MGAVAQDAGAAAAAASGDVRVQLGKLCGMLGSSHEGERSNALALLGRALTNAGLSWAWLVDLVGHGVLPGGEREKLLASLVAERLEEGLQYAWCMLPEESFYVRSTAERADLSGTNAQAIGRAIKICDGARLRADAPSRRAKGVQHEF